MIETSRMSFLGSAGLQRISNATVTVLGAGGGGSHIIQQLAHLGFGTIIAIDNDFLERSNVNRVVGATYGDLGRPKAEISASAFANLGSTIVPVVERAESTEARAYIERSDVVFGSVDSFRARYNIEAICRAACVPFIDIGLRIVCDEAGAVTGVGGQVVLSLPGGPCLQCLKIVTEGAMAADRVEYADGPPEQQVISMNGLLASQAVTSALALLSRYSGSFQPPAHVLYDGLLHELRANRYIPNAVCPHFPIGDAGWRFVFATKES